MSATYYKGIYWPNSIYHYDMEEVGYWLFSHVLTKYTILLGKNKKT